MITPRVKILEQTIIEASLRYYQGQPLLMSDAQFDGALEELRKEDPNHFILKTTGWGHSDSEAKINHIGSNPVGSLDKVKHPEKHNIMNSWGILTPKLDGLSVVVNVYDGKINALTRNNGIVGKDCTNKIVYLLQKKHPAFYKSLTEIKGLFSIRGEVVTDPSLHDHLKATVGMSLRNIAAGIINRNDVTPDLENLLYVPYFIRIDSENSYSNNKEMIDHLESMGSFPLPHEEFKKVNPDYLDSIYKDWQVGFLIDGVVISTYQDWQQGPDYTANESHSVAYKFEAEAKQAVVEKLVWNTGTAGRVVPVAVLTHPIELSGAMVQNISCHHAKNVVDNMIDKGAVLEVTRANEVIPYINRVITGAPTVDIPINCPSCGTQTVWDNTYLMCPSLDCPAQSRTLIYRFFESCNQPEGLSSTTISKWLDQFPTVGGHAKIDSIVDFLFIFAQVKHKDTAHRHKTLQDNFNDHYGNLLYKFENNIQAKLDAGITNVEFWYLLNLKGLGSESAKKMSHINPLTLESKDIVSVLSSTGVAITVCNSMRALFDKWKELSRLFKFVDAKEEVKESNKYTGIIFCATGTRDKELSNCLVNNGAREVGGISKDCNLLIAKDTNSNSGKAQTARDRKIEIISFEEARKRFL